MSAVAIDKAAAPLAAFHDTVLPSVDTESVPSCFLYWAAASLDIGAGGEGGWSDALPKAHGC